VRPSDRLRAALTSAAQQQGCMRLEVLCLRETRTSQVVHLRCTGGGDRGDLLLKLPKEAHALDARLQFELMARIWLDNRYRVSGQAFVQRPIAAFPEADAYLYEWIDGVDAEDAFVSRISAGALTAGEDITRSAGRTVAMWHRQRVHQPPHRTGVVPLLQDCALYNLIMDPTGALHIIDGPSSLRWGHPEVDLASFIFHAERSISKKLTESNHRQRVLSPRASWRSAFLDAYSKESRRPISSARLALNESTRSLRMARKRMRQGDGHSARTYIRWGTASLLHADWKKLGEVAL
jgi:hypothetical protein